MIDHSFRLLRAIALSMFLLLVACDEKDPISTARVESCLLDRSTTIEGEIASGADVASLRLVIRVAGSGTIGYSASITDGDWLSFSSRDFSANGRQHHGSVNGGENPMFLYYKANTTSEERSATLTFQFEDGSQPYAIHLTQLGRNSSNNPYFTDKDWPELPARSDNESYIYASHTARMEGRTARNYSLCFDPAMRVALWVAYPLHEAYRGSVDRTDAWAADPKIPEQYQPRLWLGSYTGSYDRGHQLPSADRTSVVEMNRQTFYASNMTPQASKLNQQMWAALESRVRGYMCSDTLYVVTGCYFDRNYDSTTDKAGNKCPIPTAYFKVLLRTRDGKSGKRIADCRSSELKSIGFWVDHATDRNLDASLCRSVAEIERLTGFRFFPEVAASVKEQQQPADWGF